jgi:hypothetical protein
VLLNTVEIVWERRCEWKQKPCGLCGKPKGSKVHTPKKTATCRFKRQNGCANCGLSKAHPDHFGGPESVNIFGSGSPEVYQRLKQDLQARIIEALEPTDLPRPCESIVVECEMTFPNLNGRDEGNFRGPLEKALGDALQEGGWLEKDTFFPVRRFTFQGIEPRYEQGVFRTRLLIFWSLERVRSVADESPTGPSRINLSVFEA